LYVVERQKKLVTDLFCLDAKETEREREREKERERKKERKGGGGKKGLTTESID